MNAPASEAAAPKAPKIEAAPKAKNARDRERRSHRLTRAVSRAGEGNQGRVFTSADPAELMQRWAWIRRASLPAASNRGMSPAETEAAVDN